jgi:putative NAD(P)-binding protein
VRIVVARELETDYLIVGAGAAGMAFADTLVSDSDAEMVIVDRRHAPGGHWNDAYPFVRLHQPAMYYGVNSTPLGTDTIDESGLNRGLYVQAGAPEICAHYDRVMRERLLPSGRVRYLPMCEHTGDGRVVSRLTGDTWDVTVRKSFVDARYLEPSIPKTTPPPFPVADGVRCVPVGELHQLPEPADGYVIVGAGKTAIDACLWLLENGVAADAITWVKPREAWLLNRYFAQSGELVGQLIEGISLQAEAAAMATSPTELFQRLAASEQLLRVDEQVTPTMFRAPTMSVAELSVLRQITNVVRLGHIRGIEPGRITMEHGTLPTSPDALHVHCAASGTSLAPAVPIFEPGRITLQCIRTGLQPFNAALIAYVEAMRDDIAEKNRLCPPNRQPNTPADWIAGTLIQWAADREWSRQEDIAAWLDRSRLNASRGLVARASEPRVQEAVGRFVSYVRQATTNLRAWS